MVNQVTEKAIYRLIGSPILKNIGNTKELGKICILRKLADLINGINNRWMILYIFRNA
jgi:hypothetical protein